MAHHPMDTTTSTITAANSKQSVSTYGTSGTGYKPYAPSGAGTSAAARPIGGSSGGASSGGAGAKKLPQQLTNERTSYYSHGSTE